MLVDALQLLEEQKAENACLLQKQVDQDQKALDNCDFSYIEMQQHVEPKMARGELIEIAPCMVNHEHPSDAETVPISEHLRVVQMNQKLQEQLAQLQGRPLIAQTAYSRPISPHPIQAHTLSDAFMLLASDSPARRELNGVPLHPQRECSPLRHLGQQQYSSRPPSPPQRAGSPSPWARGSSRPVSAVGLSPSGRVFMPEIHVAARHSQVICSCVHVTCLWELDSMLQIG